MRAILSVVVLAWGTGVGYLFVKPLLDRRKRKVDSQDALR